ncbi:MAG: hypothetical protein H0A75_07160 [Candidatus Methanofishera endochildressiae]|uniref:Uncharacterized protein n=1 Tax=Candidatus Methanofishera endochildressiae TaxID=2738884 RepID=A0A7Z0MPA1_9GAMM|nr:hypothetical protein [Candidatus Methanofishera endochildressiae]
MEWLRQSKAPMWLRFGIVGIFTAGWKILYYTPRTHKELRISQARQNGETTREIKKGAGAFKTGAGFGVESILPYICFRFILLPLLFLPLGSFPPSVYDLDSG